jgi:pimeloyl-ACP methyl ester carboxylesterase
MSGGCPKTFQGVSMTGPDVLTLAPPGHRVETRSADGTRLNVEVYRPGGPAGPIGDDAPTVVLSHGWTCSIAFWTRQVDALVADGVRVVAWDQRGHGGSGESGPAGATADALADDLAAVLAAAVPDGRPVVLAGHSMGAMAMIAFGARHPLELRRRVAAALVANTGVRDLMLRNRIVPLPLPLARLARWSPPLRRFGDRMLAWSPADPGRPPTPPTRRQRVITRYASLSRSATPLDVDFCVALINACPPAARAGFARMLSELDLDDRVPGFDVPTVVLAGTHDRLTPVWHARRMAARLPRLVELIELPGVGHMSAVQAADAVNAVLGRLVDDHLRPVPPAPVTPPERAQESA